MGRISRISCPRKRAVISSACGSSDLGGTDREESRRLDSGEFLAPCRLGTVLSFFILMTRIGGGRIHDWRSSILTQIGELLKRSSSLLTFPGSVPGALPPCGPSLPRSARIPGPFHSCRSFWPVPGPSSRLGRSPGRECPVLFDDFPETLEGLLGIGPHPGVFFFIFPGAAEPQPDHRQRSGHGAADLAVSAQASSKSTHGLYDFVVFSAQLFLPDRKNSLASVEPLHQHLGGFVAHLFFGHANLPTGETGVSCPLLVTGFSLLVAGCRLLAVLGPVRFPFAF